MNDKIAARWQKPTALEMGHSIGRFDDAMPKKLGTA
jgi:hypothetical protein